MMPSTLGCGFLLQLPLSRNTPPHPTHVSPRWFQIQSSWQRKWTITDGLLFLEENSNKSRSRNAHRICSTLLHHFISVCLFTYLSMLWKCAIITLMILKCTISFEHLQLFSNCQFIKLKLCATSLLSLNLPKPSFDNMLRHGWTLSKPWFSRHNSAWKLHFGKICHHRSICHSLPQDLSYSSTWELQTQYFATTSSQESQGGKKKEDAQNRDKQRKAHE